jgi:hypothetical protein
MPAADRFQVAIERLDDANRGDPARVNVEGAGQSATLDYAQRMTRWLERLYPDASEPLRLAVRCQHLRRWTFPRDRYPMTRAGYHQWRTAAARFHAEEAGAILRDVGYDQTTIARVQSIVRKEGLKTADPETQALEDSTCLAFLERDFAAFAARHDEQKVIGIVQRTWRKMSSRAQEAALGLHLSSEARRLIERALSPLTPGGPEGH